MQCQAVTLRGVQCSREAKEQYCTQHLKINNLPVDIFGEIGKYIPYKEIAGLQQIREFKNLVVGKKCIILKKSDLETLEKIYLLNPKIRDIQIKGLLIGAVITIFNILSKFKNLEALTINGHYLDPQFKIVWSEFKNLKYLAFSGYITVPNLLYQLIEQIPKLEYLSLPETKKSKDERTWIAPEKLQTLELFSDKWSLSEFPYIKRLIYNEYNDRTPDIFLDSLVNLDNLQVLETTNYILLNYIQTSKLLYLTLDQNYDIHQSLNPFTTSNFENLEFLRLVGGYLLIELKDALRNLKKLRHIEIMELNVEDIELVYKILEPLKSQNPELTLNLEMIFETNKVLFSDKTEEWSRLQKLFELSNVYFSEAEDGHLESPGYSSREWFLKNEYYVKQICGDITE